MPRVVLPALPRRLAQRERSRQHHRQPRLPLRPRRLSRQAGRLARNRIAPRRVPVVDDDAAGREVVEVAALPPEDDADQAETENRNENGNTTVRTNACPKPDGCRRGERPGSRASPRRASCRPYPSNRQIEERPDHEGDRPDERTVTQQVLTNTTSARKRPMLTVTVYKPTINAASMMYAAVRDAHLHSSLAGSQPAARSCSCRGIGRGRPGPSGRGLRFLRHTAINDARDRAVDADRAAVTASRASVAMPSSTAPRANRSRCARRCRRCRPC